MVGYIVGIDAIRLHVLANLSRSMHIGAIVKPQLFETFIE